ncbi:SDR family oxidoreductase [Methanoculleus sp. YWC-01]|jgi:NAD(P)-dependent dehydrogenase (short-subunit alcohol dehydrogenase family)|uniref:SDR family oxidoreductase n=1 Tax=Methanoculleus nereidis TaxID=2735141 RepID=A0ABU3Z4I1_9EURY|nr:SDR family oxidoreductase [Methanoculleus sp. YWC-01]MCK9298894.1 SDR family oxidoreductase [Methanoculleus sp.]MDV4343714.1 SDR family oxidoreductase [Methanoculleus sp. YWC-01]
MGRLEGKVAIVTGASSGMGAAITKRFAAEGANVIAIARRKEKLQGVIDEVTGKGGTAIAVSGDVSKEEDVKNAVKTAVDTFGKLDIVVNNAGSLDRVAPVGDLDDKTWEQVFAVNVDGPMYMFRAAIPEMLKNPGDAEGLNKGAFVTVSSIGGTHGGHSGAAYTASKHASLGLAKNTGYMYAKKGIRSNIIAPGYVATEMVELSQTTQSHPEGMELVSAGVGANPRMGKAEEIANLALFLASDEASLVNGAVVPADAGWSAW